MFASFSRKSLPDVKNVAVNLYDVHIHNCPSISLIRCIASIPNQGEHSVLVSYLIHSLGFSEEAALKLGSLKHLHVKTPKKLDLALEFFKNYGFSKTQVSDIVRRCPQLLLSNPEKTLLPKFEFLCSKGLKEHDLMKLVSSNPVMLKRSLENCIIPCYHFLKTMLGSDEKALTAFKSSSWNWGAFSQSCMEPNIAILREYGVHQSNILYLLLPNPRTLMVGVDQFRTVVEEVNALGINPLNVQFVIAIRVKRALNKSTWQSKLNAYRNWGLSDREVMSAFTKQPLCMMHSEVKINALFDYLVNKMGWEASFIAKHPLIISFSMENRIIPRCAVFSALFSKGLIEKNISLSSLFIPTEKVFLHRYVTDYEKEVPHLLNLYQQKLALAK